MDSIQHKITESIYLFKKTTKVEHIVKLMIT